MRGTYPSLREAMPIFAVRVEPRRLESVWREHRSFVFSPGVFSRLPELVICAFHREEFDQRRDSQTAESVGDAMDWHVSLLTISPLVNFDGVFIKRSIRFRLTAPDASMLEVRICRLPLFKLALRQDQLATRAQLDITRSVCVFVLTLSPSCAGFVLVGFDFVSLSFCLLFFFCAFFVYENEHSGTRMYMFSFILVRYLNTLGTRTHPNE